MSVPALAQIGNYSGQTKYYDDAIKKVLQFSDRMFNYEKGLCMHGLIQGMDEKGGGKNFILKYSDKIKT